MKIAKVCEALHAQPFLPFWIHLADGGRIPVKHEDFVAVNPAGRWVGVFLPDGSHHLIDVLMITRLETKPDNGLHQKK